MDSISKQFQLINTWQNLKNKEETVDNAKKYCIQEIEKNAENITELNNQFIN